MGQAKALSRIWDIEVIFYLWKNVVCKFGTPKEIVTDNGTQFTSTKF